MRINSKMFLKKSLIVGIASFYFFYSNTELFPKQNKPNVVFIVVEDIYSGTLGSYGNKIIKTPNLDRLANEGVLFKKSFTNGGSCLPSRTSFMSGLRPETTGQIGTYEMIKNEYLSVTRHNNLYGYFLDNNYITATVGKLFDSRLKRVMHLDSGVRQLKIDTSKIKSTWDNLIFESEEIEKLNSDAKDGLLLEEYHESERWGWPFFWGPVSTDDSELEDGLVTQAATNFINEMKDSDKPFFLSVGLHVTHVPFTAPKKYFDLYALEDMPTEGRWIHDPEKKNDLWDFGLKSSCRIFNRTHYIPKTMVQRIVQAYYAQTSFMDALTGLILNALEKTGLKENTIVVFIGDHGFHLGTRNKFAKNTEYDQVLQAPLIMSVPGKVKPGTVVEGMVEFVDIMPTLGELCGFNKPSWDIEGLSFVPLLSEPKRSWKKAIFAVNTDYTRIIRTEEWTLSVVPDGLCREPQLFNLVIDPEQNNNVYHSLENRQIIDSLKEQMRLGWKNALPKN